LIRFEAAAAAAGSHEVPIGPIEEAAESIRALGGSQRLSLVTDQAILALHGAGLR
jgi:hypothetical protein